MPDQNTQHLFIGGIFHRPGVVIFHAVRHDKSGLAIKGLKGSILHQIRYLGFYINLVNAQDVCAAC